MNHQVLNDDVIKLKKETPHDMWLVYISPLEIVFSEEKMQF